MSSLRVTEQKTLSELNKDECFYFFGELWIVKKQTARSTIGRSIQDGKKGIELNNSTLVEHI